MTRTWWLMFSLRRLESGDLQIDQPLEIAERGDQEIDRSEQAQPVQPEQLLGVQGRELFLIDAVITAEVIAQLSKDRDLDLDLFQQIHCHQLAIQQSIGPQARVDRLQHALDALQVRRLAAEWQEHRLPIRAQARMLLIDHYLHLRLHAGRRIGAVLGADVAQRERTARQRRRDEGAGPSIALDEQVLVFLEAQDGVSDETRRLLGLAQQERIFPVQLVELGTQRNGTVHHVAVFGSRTCVDGYRPVLVAGQDT